MITGNDIAYSRILVHIFAQHHDLMTKVAVVVFRKPKVERKTP